MFKDLFPTLSFKCTVKWKTEARKHAFRHSNLTRKNKFSFETMEFSRPENRAPKQPPPRRMILQLLQKNYATVGICPNRESFNLRVIIGSLLMTSYFICNLVFVFFEAKTFTDYTQSVFMGSVAALTIFLLFVIILKKNKLLNFIKNCENLVNRSKLARAPIFALIDDSI